MHVGMFPANIMMPNQDILTQPVVATMEPLLQATWGGQGQVVFGTPGRVWRPVGNVRPRQVGRAGEFAVA